LKRTNQTVLNGACGPSMIVVASRDALEPSQRLSSKRFGLSPPSWAYSGVAGDPSKASRSR
jgi:hypothetical protein